MLPTQDILLIVPVVPFVVTIVVALLFTSYMLFDPAKWLVDFMQLTPMSQGFRLFISALGITYLAFASAGETIIFPALSNLVGKIIQKTRTVPKTKKLYKQVQEQMRL
jgi:cation-transporting ATPase 13A3/4/5